MCLHIVGPLQLASAVNVLVCYEEYEESQELVCCGLCVLVCCE